jgi:tetratricopeptide (TPR) repeat protein
VYRQSAGPKMEILDKMSARREVIGDDWISRGGCRNSRMRLKCLAILATGFILAGCHRGIRPVVVAPPAIVPVVVLVATPVPVPFDIPDSLPHMPPTPPSLLEQAERAFALGNYPEAIQTYEALPSREQSDQALFHLGIAYVLNDANWVRAKANLKRLVDEYPDSSLTPTAALILSLRSGAVQLGRDTKARNEAIQQLSTELERLKRIDADRRRRR